MLTRLKNWVQASRERKREKMERDYGSLNKQEREHVERSRQGFEPAEPKDRQGDWMQP
jgi:hypothetical protein